MSINSNGTNTLLLNASSSPAAAAAPTTHENNTPKKEGTKHLPPIITNQAAAVVMRGRNIKEVAKEKPLVLPKEKQLRKGKIMPQKYNNAITTMTKNDVTTSNNNTTITTALEGPCIAYKFELPGLGSQLLNIFAIITYQKKVHNKKCFIALLHEYDNYKLTEDIGFLTGYFTPKLPVIDTQDQYKKYIEPNIMPGVSNNNKQKRNTSNVNYNTTTRIQIGSHVIQLQDGGQAIELKKTYPDRLDYKKYLIRYDVKWSNFYLQMLQTSCQHIQYHSNTKHLIQQYLMNTTNAKPSTTLLNNAINEMNNQKENVGLVESVAFHVRRGDKLLSESRKYEATEYVNKLISVLNKTSNTRTKKVRIKYCFIASDDYKVIEEMKIALSQYGTTRNCQILSLIPPPKDPKKLKGRQQQANKLDEMWQFARRKKDNTIRFLTELHLLIKTKYFIGTFNSNVGGLVAVMRGCYHLYDSNNDKNDNDNNNGNNYDLLLKNHNHYAQSYGVDKDEWSIR